MKKCNFCGNRHVREAQVQYIYRHDEKLLLVNNVPCEQCEFCGEKYFKAQVLRNIELDFKKIYSAGKKAKKELKVPVEEYKEVHRHSPGTAA
ncbi:MAG: YgiT-type zinc finger protein [Deltaproteobacteria bacterium]|nr:YgiT-type zinc finger protein [Deltaproteobacteria bacterium]